MLVKDSNDFVVVSLVYRQAKSFAHGELSEPGRFRHGACARELHYGFGSS